ncbi:MAG: dihydrofolate reductase [Verrucomicrobiales bacterium]
MIRVTLIAALARVRTIGDGGKIPWHLPRDVAHFRAYTLGKALLAGRRTFEEMRGWFTDHTPFILTNQPTRRGGFRTVRTPAQAAEAAAGLGFDELVVIGGAQTYAAALPAATDLLLTRIEADITGDSRFPRWDVAAWRLDRREEWPADADNEFAMTLEHWQRSAPDSGH